MTPAEVAAGRLVATLTLFFEIERDLGVKKVVQVPCSPADRQAVCKVLGVAGYQFAYNSFTHTLAIWGEHGV